MPNCRLQKMAPGDSGALFEMMTTLPASENHFHNQAHGMDEAHFQLYLTIRDRYDRGAGLPEDRVPETGYYLIVDDDPVGFGWLRRNLTVAQARKFGHIALTIRPEMREQGLGIVFLHLLKQAAAKEGTRELSLIVAEGNVPARRMMEGCGGRLVKKNAADGRLYYAMDTQSPSISRRLMNDIIMTHNKRVEGCFPLAGGHLHRKTRFVDDGKTYVVKRYNVERYPSAALDAIERALSRQMIVARAGVPAPRVLRTPERTFIRRLDDPALNYIVMNYIDGQSPHPSAVTARQLHAIGAVLARMHRALAEISPQNEPFVGAYMDTLSAQIEAYQRESTKLSAPITADLSAAAQNLGADIPNHLPRGWVHGDFTPNHLLLEGDTVVGILDWEQNHYGHPLRDVGRMVLSFAFDGQSIDVTRTRILVEGYASETPLRLQDVETALRALWCEELDWIAPAMYHKPLTPRARRRQQEMEFLTEKLAHNESILPKSP